MKGTILLVMLALLGWNLSGNDGVPVAISPGSDAGVAAVGNGCPTFSWSGVAWAQKYRLVVFGVEGEKTRNNGEAALTPQPVLSEDIAGGGLSWTPSLSQGLAAGADYAWCVGAMDADGAWSWSATRRFRVELGTRSALSEEDTAAMKEKKETAAADSATNASAGNDAGKKDATENIAKPMGSEGTLSTFYGTGAGANISSDNNENSFFGSSAGNGTTSGARNTFVGRSAGVTNSTGYRNSFFGVNAGYNNTTSYQNNFIGYNAGYSNTTGRDNIFIGVAAGYSSTVGHTNIFLGTENGYYNTSGTGNVFLGYKTGYNNSTGNYNTGVGYYSGFSTTGSYNVFLGYNAGSNETGSNKLYIDNSNTSLPLIYGDFSTDMVGINGWLGVGTKAPAYPIELKTTGRNAAIVATRTDGAVNFVNATTSYGQFGTVNNFAVRILANAVWRMTLNTDNSLAMASGATCTAGGKWTDASSRALKENISDLGSSEALAALQGLKPVRFTYKADKTDEEVGFIAEDVPELVATRDRKGMSAMDVVAVLTKVVQEQHEEISLLKSRLSALEIKASERMDTNH